VLQRLFDGIYKVIALTHSIGISQSTMLREYAFNLVGMIIPDHRSGGRSVAE